MRVVGLVFAGIPYHKPWYEAAWDVRRGPVLPFLPEGTDGFMLADDLNPSHHYAGLLFLGYFAGGGISEIVNFARDYNNSPDIRLGNVASRHGARLRGQPWGPNDLPGWMMADLR